MSEYLELTIDKFTFKIATDRFYTGEGLWARPEGSLVRIGLSDYLGQRSGDVAFAEVRPHGTKLDIDEEIAVIETIKVNISLGSPVNATVIEVNPLMETAPEVINQDPYGAGWLAFLEAIDWQTDQARLMDPQAYFARIKAEAEQEVSHK